MPERTLVTSGKMVANPSRFLSQPGVAITH
jgi:hypothetical protein